MKERANDECRCECNFTSAWYGALIPILIILGIITSGIILSGCESGMAYYEGKKTEPSKELVATKPEFYVDSIENKINTQGYKCSDGVEELSKKFAVSTNEAQRVPITIEVNGSYVSDVNGNGAAINNFFSVFTLTFWPYISSEKYNFNVNVSSVLGNHSYEGSIIERKWTSLFLLGMIPVPGWADMRGDVATLQKNRIKCVNNLIISSLADLNQDYSNFQASPAKYKDILVKDKSKRALAHLSKVIGDENKEKLVNKIIDPTVVTNAQNSFVKEYNKAESDNLKRTLVKKMTDETLNKLPYDNLMVERWRKVTNQNILAQMYKTDGSKMSSVDRAEVMGKITDTNIISQLIKKQNNYSKNELLRVQNKEYYQKYDVLEKQIDKLESHINQATRHSSRVKYREELAECKKEMEELKKHEPKEVLTLYIEDNVLRFETYQHIKNQQILADILCSEELFNGMPADKKEAKTLNTRECKDIKFDVARQLVKVIDDEDCLMKIAQKASCYSLRYAAIEKISKQENLLKLHENNWCSCPIDITINTKSKDYDEFERASTIQIRELIILRMTDEATLKSIRASAKEIQIMEIVTKRLRELGVKEITDIINRDKYSAELLCMLNFVESKEELIKIANEAKLRFIRVRAAQKASDTELTKCLAKEMANINVKPTKEHFNLDGIKLGTDIGDAYTVLLSKYPNSKPRIYNSTYWLSIFIGDGDERGIIDTLQGSGVIKKVVIPPAMVRAMVGFKSGSFPELYDAVQKKFDVTFGEDKLQLGRISQTIGNVENVNGETLRYFTGKIVDRSESTDIQFLTAINNEDQEGFLDALKTHEEEEKKDDYLASQGSLMLLYTKDAPKNEYGETGVIGYGQSVVKRNQSQTKSSTRRRSSSSKAVGGLMGFASGLMKGVAKEALGSDVADDLIDASVKISSEAAEAAIKSGMADKALDAATDMTKKAMKSATKSGIMDKALEISGDITKAAAKEALGSDVADGIIDAAVNVDKALIKTAVESGAMDKALDASKNITKEVMKEAVKESNTNE